MSTKKTDYVTEAQGRLISQFSGAARLRALVAAFANRAQEFEDAYHPLLAERSLDSATGDRLDIIGQIVKEKRAGRTDDTYRGVLQAELAILRSKGTTEELIVLIRQLVELLTGPNPTDQYDVIEFAPKTIYFRPVDEQIGTTTAQSIAPLLRRAAAAATELLFVYSAFTDAETLTLSTQGDVVETSASLGLANDAKTTGGHFSGAA